MAGPGANGQQMIATVLKWAGKLVTVATPWLRSPIVIAGPGREVSAKYLIRLYSGAGLM